MSEVTTQPPHNAGNNDNTTTATIIYALYLVSLLLALTSIIGLIMAYINKGNNADYLETHYQFQIRTFWIGLLYTIVGVITAPIFIGWLILGFTVIWLIIRCAKGIKLLGQKQAVSDPQSWMFG